MTALAAAYSDEEIEEEVRAIAKECWEHRHITDRQYHVFLLHREGKTYYQIRKHTVAEYDAEGARNVSLYTCHVATLQREYMRAANIIKSAIIEKHEGNIRSEIAIARGHDLDDVVNPVLEASFWKCRAVLLKKNQKRPKYESFYAFS